MAKLSKEEEEHLARLTAKRDAPDEPDDDGDQDDDAGVVVLRGSRADAFLSGLLGSKKKKREPAPADGDGPGDGDGDGDGDPAGDDPEPPRQHRYFR